MEVGFKQLLTASLFVVRWFNFCDKNLNLRDTVRVLRFVIGRDM